jgi:hypothetical protein
MLRVTSESRFLSTSIAFEVIHVPTTSGTRLNKRHDVFARTDGHQFKLELVRITDVVFEQEMPNAHISH